jgi:ketosteroid isomerase-like protein
MKHCPECHRCYDDARADCADDQSALVESRPGSPLLAGKYRLEEFLGRGGHGTAYEATALADGRPVIAVELLRAEVLDDPQALERFHSAAQAAGRNNGQEVGEIRESGPLPGGGAYVVMGLLDEETDGPAGAVTAPGQDETPTSVVEARDTGRLRPQGRTTGRLSKVGAEMTQEVRLIPVPRPPAGTAAAEDAAPFKDAGVTRVVDARKRPQADSPRNAASGVAGRAPAPAAVDARRRATPRRSPSAYKLGLVLIPFVCALLLVYAFSRMRSGTAETPAADPDATQSQSSQATATATLPDQRASTPTPGQVSPDATGSDGAQPSAPSEGGTAAAITAERLTARDAGREVEVRELLNDWVAAADARNVGRLMAFYAPELETFYDKRDITSSSLRAELTRLFGRVEKVETRVVGEPRIAFQDGGRAATARVRLGYAVEDKRGRKRKGEVTQQLRLVKADGGWKISGQGGENMLR